MRPDAGTRGFTLIELVVVIAVILVVAGITLSVGVVVVEQSERYRTRVTVELLDAAVKEWELAADRRLTWWNGDDDPALWDRADIHGDTPEVLIISEVLEVIRRAEAARTILARIDPDIVHTYAAGAVPPWVDGALDPRFIGALTVLDAWDTPIYATHPGRAWTSADGASGIDRDDDGTIHTPNEHHYGTAPNRQVVFVSAGPDGRFGLPQEFPGYGNYKAIAEARKDNIFSVAPASE